MKGEAQDVLSQTDSWTAVEAKNAESSLFLSLLAAEGGAGPLESLGSGVLLAGCPGLGDTTFLSVC